MCSCHMQFGLLCIRVWYNVLTCVAVYSGFKRDKWSLYVIHTWICRWISCLKKKSTRLILSHYFPDTHGSCSICLCHHVKQIFLLDAWLDSCIQVFWMCWSYILFLFWSFPWLLLSFIKHFITVKPAYTEILKYLHIYLFNTVTSRWRMGTLYTPFIYSNYKTEIHTVLCFSHLWGCVISWVSSFVEKKLFVFSEVFGMGIWFSSHVKNSI